MPLAVNYQIDVGNTVPYPPLFDGVRCNHGFVDLRGRADLVDSIPEAAVSSALRKLLLDLSDKNSKLMSVGCDLGSRKHKSEDLGQKHRSGGYLQIAILPLSAPDRRALHMIAKGVEFCLGDRVGHDVWMVTFSLCRTHFKLEASIETETLWVWFDAAAMTQEKARSSRERLILALADSVRHHI